MDIRPVSDLRNKFTEIEEAVRDQEPVFLTKNGRGIMVVMSMEAYVSMRNAAGVAFSASEQFARVDAQKDENEDFFRRFRAMMDHKKLMEAAHAEKRDSAR